MMSKEEKKASRKAANHKYYMQNHVKWQEFYPKSTASELGTGNLVGHRLSTHDDEYKAVSAEIRRIGLKSVRTKVHVGGE